MWYNSAMTYDMITANPWNNMNLHMNQLWDHSLAWNNMFQYPQYDFNNYMPYGNPIGNSYLTNPFYTLNQMAWNSPTWNNNIGFGLNGGIASNWGMNNGLYGNMGWFGSQFGTVAPSNSNTNNNNNNTANKKYTRLLNLVKQLVKYDALSPSDADSLNNAIKNTKGTADEKYERLLEAYEEVDKDVIREFLAEGSKNLKITDKDTFLNRLIAAGHEYSDIKSDDVMDDFRDGIKSLKGSDGTDSEVEDVIDKIKDGNLDILDFVSSWNSDYKKEDKGVIEFIAKYYNGIDDKDAKSTAKSKILVPFVRTLIGEAKELKGYLNSESKKAIEDAIDKVDKALDGVKTEKSSKIGSSLANAFDKLYLLTRRAAMEKLQNDAKAYYGEIDSKVFNNELFEDDMIEDLKSEGFDDSEIEAAEVSLSKKESRKSEVKVMDKKDVSDDDDDDENPLKDIDEKQAGEQVEILITNKYLHETTCKKDGQIVYEEVKATVDIDDDGKPDYKRLFYIENGKLVEWGNTKLDGDGKPVKADTNSSEAQVSKLIKVSDIAKAKTEAVVAEEKAKEKAEEKAETEDEELTEEAAEKLGETLADHLNGYTNTTEREECELIINNKMNSANVFNILKGYQKDEKWFNERIIEQIVSEDDWEERATYAMKIATFVKENLEKRLKTETDEATKEELKSDIQILDYYFELSADSWNETWTTDAGVCEKIDNIIYDNLK